MKELQKVIAVVGPTASGKSRLAMELAKKFNGEIISADSMQIYKGMDIATAKPSRSDMEEIPHHMINIANANEVFSVAKYKVLAQKAIEEVVRNGRTPIVVGGTGLYLDVLLKNIVLSNETDNDDVRKRLYAELDLVGADKMLERLQKIDPETAKKLHTNDTKRIVRALEVYEVSGTTQTQQNAQSLRTPSPYNVLYIGLKAHNREFLYERMNKRVVEMVSLGLLEEVQENYEKDPTGTSVQAIGYKEIIPYIKGTASLEECLETLKRSTRRYAKRQLTWFRKNHDIYWLYIDEYSKDELYSRANERVEEFL